MDMIMRRTTLIFAATLVLVVAGCKASETSAQKDDSANAESSAAATDEPEESGTQSESADADEDGATDKEPRVRPSRQEGDQLAHAMLDELQSSDIHATWTKAQQAGATAVIGWYPFGFEGGSSLGPMASMLKSWLESKSVNTLPIDVAGLQLMAERKGVDLSNIRGSSEIEVLTELARTLNLGYAGTGTLIRDTSSGSAVFKLRVLIVDGSTGEPAFDSTVTAEQPQR